MINKKGLSHISAASMMKQHQQQLISKRSLNYSQSRDEAAGGNGGVGLQSASEKVKMQAAETP